MSAIILLDLPPTANHLFPGERRRYKSTEYKKWIEDAGWQLLMQKPPKFDGQVSVGIEVREPPTMQAEDLESRCKATVDLLVRHRIIRDDSQHYVRRLTMDWSGEVEGVRVTVSGWNT